MDINEQIFAAAFFSLQGQPATTDAFRTITRACVRCAMLWLDGFAQMTATLDDAQLVAILTDIAREELASLRKAGDRLNFEIPNNSRN